MLFAFAAEGGVATDPAKTVGPNACAECHKQEAEAWKATHHFKTFREMPRNNEANEIAEKMGVRRIKSESLCLNCHFTVQQKNNKEEPVSGISCESCHGSGRDWIKVHSGFSGKKEQTETKAEEEARWKLADSKGMIRPGSLYQLAKNCYGCHVVPQEDLVNRGGHRAGSAFELVSWSQGEVLHNTWYSKGKDNVPASAARKQLAAAAKAAPSVPEIAKMVEFAYSAGLKLNNERFLTTAADGVSKLLASINEKYDGSTMAGLDSLIPGPDKFKGTARKASATN